MKFSNVQHLLFRPNYDIAAVQFSVLDVRDIEGESPQELRRLHYLREWDHEQDEKIFTGNQRAWSQADREGTQGPSSLWSAIESIAPKIGCAAVTLHERGKKHEIDTGVHDGVPTVERERIQALEREVKELSLANEILRQASAFFAQAEFDPVSRRSQVVLAR